MTLVQPRVEIFLDSSNFYNGLSKQFGDGKVDFPKLVTHILDGRQLVSFNLYTGTVDCRREPSKAMGQQDFLRAVSNLPFQTRIFAFPLRYYASWPNAKPQEKGVDAKIVQDLIMGAVDRTYDVAVLLSGDQDFSEVCKLLHNRFSIPIETYYPISRRHLYESCRSAFTKSQVITKKFYNSIR